MITVLVTFIFMDSEVRGQCPLNCNSTGNVRLTIDHVADAINNADCGNDAQSNGSCAVAAGQYSYALLLDGRQVLSKQFVVVH